MCFKNKINDICHLCLKSKTLVQSHVIPKFLWKCLKKSDGFYTVLSDNPRKYKKKEQREIKEPLFCKNCDTVRLQKNEEHLARVLIKGKKIEGKPEGDFLHLRGFDYKKVKNGLLSILWRMSLSENDFFKEVDLGEKHSERIRQIILNEESTPSDEYPILLLAPFLNGKLHRDWMIPPSSIKDNGNRRYRCLISGFLFMFIIGSATIGKEDELLNLREDGSWCVFRRDATKLPFIREHISAIMQSSPRTQK